MIPAPTLDEAWYDQMQLIMEEGRETSPRGQLTKELPSKTLVFDMNYPVITHPTRALGYKFMAAEAWWILSGRDDVACAATLADHQQGVAGCKLGAKRRAQGAGRKHASIADAAAAVDHRQREILRKRGVLQAVAQRFIVQHHPPARRDVRARHSVPIKDEFVVVHCPSAPAVGSPGCRRQAWD